MKNTIADVFERQKAHSGVLMSIYIPPRHVRPIVNRWAFFPPTAHDILLPPVSSKRESIAIKVLVITPLRFSQLRVVVLILRKLAKKQKQEISQNRLVPSLR